MPRTAFSILHDMAIHTNVHASCYMRVQLERNELAYTVFKVK